MITEEEFFTAVLKGDENIVKKAIDEGFNLDTLTQYSKGTALHTAISLGNISMCKILIDNGINLEICSKAGMTPLMLAIGSLGSCKKEKKSDYLAIIEMLLIAGAKPTYTNRQGEEEFAYLCMSGRTRREIGEIFVKLGIVEKSKAEIVTSTQTPPIQVVEEKPTIQEARTFKKAYLPQPSLWETVTSMFFGQSKDKSEDTRPLIESRPKLKKE